MIMLSVFNACVCLVLLVVPAASSPLGNELSEEDVLASDETLNLNTADISSQALRGLKKSKGQKNRKSKGKKYKGDDESEEDESEEDASEEDEEAATISVTYSPIALAEDEPQLNPERGLYRQISYMSESPQRLTDDDMISLRESGDGGVAESSQSLLLRLYLLHQFVDTDTLSQEFLDDMDADMDTVRRNGNKVILRFAYSDGIEPEVDEPWDAPKETVLVHIQQLKPLFAKHEDIIAVVQAGFIGAFGEWFFSTNFGNPTLDEQPDWDARREVILALLDALPSSVMVQARTPLQKMTLLEEVEALNSQTAFADDYVSRLGHHNDCFLASEDDLGTYDADADIRALEYTYLEEDARYTSMGGETCQVNAPRSECSVAQQEMELFSWTYLNSGYNGDVLSSFVSGGCMEEIVSRLGYRLVLTEGLYSLSASPGGSISYGLTVVNEGYAAPIQNRNIDIVLRHLTTGDICVARDSTPNMRTWFGGTTNTLSGTAHLPVDTPNGTYELLLNLGDPSQSLSRRTEYKMKVANGDNVNEDGTGLIKLRHTILVDSTMASQSTGDDNLVFTCDAGSSILPAPTTDVLGDTFVTNGGFEGAPTNEWNIFDDGFAVSTTESKTGLQSVQVTNGAASQVVVLDAPAGSTITLSGYSKAVGVAADISNSNYAVFADVALVGADPLFGQTAAFTGGTHDWEYSESSFLLENAASSLTLYAMYRGDTGTAYFDDLKVLVDGKEAIVSCPEGYYYDTTEAICTWCEPGNSCDIVAGTITPCNADTYAPGGNHACRPCEGCNGRGTCSALSGLCVCDEGRVGAFCQTPTA